MRRRQLPQPPQEQLPPQPVLLAAIACLLAVIACLIGLLTMLLYQHQLYQQQPETPPATALALTSASLPSPAVSSVNLTALYVTALDEILGGARPPTARRDRLLAQLLAGNCRRRFRPVRSLGVGWSKAASLVVDVASGESFAVKRPHTSGHDMLECLRRTLGDVAGCYGKLAGKFLRELVFLQLLAGTEGVVRVKGWCLAPSDFYVATEAGTPLDIISLLQMSWEDRLRIASDLSQLLLGLHASPVGSLALRDFRRGQFALVDGGRTKLIDLDDLDGRLPRCSRPDGHCSEKVDRLSYVRTQCRQAACPDHNDLANVHRARGQFYSFLLLHGAPPGLTGGVRALAGSGGRRFGAGGSRKLRDDVRRLVLRYSSGDYPLTTSTVLNGQQTVVDGGAEASKFRLVANSSVAGSDYPCGYTISGAKCAVTAISLAEARVLCAGEPACRGFVVTPGQSWTNRTVIILKSGADRIVASQGHQLYLRR